MLKAKIVTNFVAAEGLGDGNALTITSDDVGGCHKPKEVGWQV